MKDSPVVKKLTPVETVIQSEDAACDRGMHRTSWGAQGSSLIHTLEEWANEGRLGTVF